MANVFVVDDHSAVRLALEEMLCALGYTVALYDSAESFLRTINRSQTGCIVADVRMPGMDGIELVRELQRRELRLPVVLISGHADVPMAVAAIKAGAEDFIEKPIDDVQLVAAINRGLASAADPDRRRGSIRELQDRFDRLTPREVETFDLVALGFTSQAIAARLGLSIRTVESYRVSMMGKMQAESIAILVRQAIRLGRIIP